MRFKFFFTGIGWITAIAAAYAHDTYDTATNTLNIPVVAVGDALYKNVQVTVGGVKSVGGQITPSLSPLQDAMRLVYSTPWSASAKFTGVEGGKSVSGTTSTSISEISNASFEGKQYRSAKRTRKNYDANGNELSSDRAQVFIDQNYTIVGEIDRYYRVVTNTSVVSGVMLQTIKVYDSSAKQNLYAVNFETLYAEVDASDPSKILLYNSGEGRDVSGNLLNTWTGILSVDTATGVITNKSYTGFGKTNAEASILQFSK